MKDGSSELLLHAARNFDALIGAPTNDVPFLIAIWNESTERIEFVTNMDKKDQANFIKDMYENWDEPFHYEVHPRGMN